MKPVQKLAIDIFSFIKQGKLDVLETGQTRDWVLNNFPDPDDFEDGVSWKNGEFEIFAYGDLELHFSNDILYLIFADYQGTIDSGDSLLFTNQWIFKKDTMLLNLPYVMQELNNVGINFTIEKKEALNSITIHLESKVAFHFESEESNLPQDYMFVAFWVIDKALLTRK